MKKLYFAAFLACMMAPLAKAETAPATNTLPEGVEAEQWILQYEYEARFVNVAIAGDKVYLGNLTDLLPDSYVVGEIKDGIVTFPLTELGYSEYWECNLYFTPCVFDTRYVADFDEEVEDYFIAESLPFTINLETKEIENSIEYAAVFISDSDAVGELASDYVEYFFEPFIHWADPADAEAPLEDPEFIDAFNDPWYNCDIVDVYLSTINSKGYPLNTENAWYVFYVDGKPFTFTTDVYEGIPADMTEIPFDYCDEDNQDIWSYGEVHQISLYLESYSTVGIKMYYRTPAGTVLETEYVEADIEVLSDGDISGVAANLADDGVVAAEYYDLSGRRIARPAGFCIKVETKADGSRSSRRVYVVR